MPGVIVRLSALEGELTVDAQTDAAGVYQFPAVPCGRLHAFGAVSGIPLHSPSASASPGYRRRFPWPSGLATLTETVTVVGGKEAIDGPRTDRGYRASVHPCAHRRTPAATWSLRGKSGQVNPRYRQAWFDARLEGRILLQARIGVDGRIREVEVVSPVNAELEEEAVGAVSQWEFTPTLAQLRAGRGADVRDRGVHGRTLTSGLSGLDGDGGLGHRRRLSLLHVVLIQDKQ